MAAKNGNLVILVLYFAIANKSAVDRFQQFFFAYWFRKKVFRASLDRLHRRRDISVTAQENDG